jgi:hypothetical protein
MKTMKAMKTGAIKEKGLGMGDEGQVSIPTPAPNPQPLVPRPSFHLLTP